MLSSQLGRYKTETVLHFLFFYIAAFPVIYTAACLRHGRGRLRKPFEENFFSLVTALGPWGDRMKERNRGRRVLGMRPERRKEDRAH